MKPETEIRQYVNKILVAASPTLVKWDRTQADSFLDLLESKVGQVIETALSDERTRIAAAVKNLKDDGAGTCEIEDCDQCFVRENVLKKVLSLLHGEATEGVE